LRAEFGDTPGGMSQGSRPVLWSEPLAQACGPSPDPAPAGASLRTAAAVMDAACIFPPVSARM